MSCRNCGTTTNLFTVGVVDLSDEDADTFTLVMCRGCLGVKGLFCDVHDEPKLLVYDPDLQEKEGELALASACLECSANEADELSHTMVTRYTELLKDTCPQSLLEGLGMVGESLLDTDIKRPMAFAVVVASKLFGRTLNETVTQLITSANGSVSLN